MIWIKRKKWLEKDKFNCIYRAFIVLDYQFLTYLTKVASKFANPVSVRFHITYTHSPDLLYTFFALRASSPSCTASVWAKFWFRRSLYPSHWRQLLCSAGGPRGTITQLCFFSATIVISFRRSYQTYNPSFTIHMEKELKNGTFEPSLRHSCAKKRASRIFFSVRENVFAAQYREKLEITDFTFQAETGKQDLFFWKA